MDGLVLPHDDPFWEVYAPANGWGCSCSSRAINERQMKKLGLTLSDSPAIEYEDHIIGARTNNPLSVRVPKGIDPGFEYRPGQVGRIKAVTPRELDEPIQVLRNAPKATDLLPKPLSNSTPKLDVDDKNEAEIVQQFLDEFGARGKEAVIFTDILGSRIPLSGELFKNGRGNWKLFKNDRHLSLHLLIDTLKQPDEIWVVEDPKGKKTVFRKRYIRRFPDGGGLGGFEVSSKAWRAITLFNPTEEYVQRLGYESLEAYLDDQRRGVRIHRREDENQ